MIPTRLTDAATQYLAKITGWFAQASGNANDGLYIASNTGDWLLSPGAMILELEAIHNDTDRDYVRSVLGTGPAGPMFIDLRNGDVHLWGGSAWTVTGGVLDEALPKGRLCFCPTTSKVFHRDAGGNLRQLLST